MGGDCQDRRRSVTNANNCIDTGSVASSISGRRSNYKQRVSDSRRRKLQILIDRRERRQRRKDRHNEYNTTNEEKLNRHLCYGASGIASSKSCCSNHESGDHSDLLVHDEIGARSTLRGSVNGYRAKPSSDRPHSVDLERKGENSCVNSTRRTLCASSTSKSTKRKSMVDNRSQPSSQNH